MTAWLELLTFAGDGSDPRRTSGHWRALTALEPAAGALWSAPTAACRAVLDPLAHALNLPVGEHPALGNGLRTPTSDGGDAWVDAAWRAGAALTFVDVVLTRTPGGRIVCCGHPLVVPALVALLAARDGLVVGDVGCPPGARLTLTFEEGRCTGIARVEDGSGRGARRPRDRPVREEL